MIACKSRGSRTTLLCSIFFHSLKQHCTENYGHGNWLGGHNIDIKLDTLLLMGILIIQAPNHLDFNIRNYSSFPHFGIIDFKKNAHTTLLSIL